MLLVGLDTEATTGASVKRTRRLRAGPPLTSRVRLCLPAASQCRHKLGEASVPSGPPTPQTTSRRQAPRTGLDVHDRPGHALARAAGIAVEDLPAIITPTPILRRATADEVADRIGLAFRADYRHDLDVVVGGGPRGLAAAMYGASEGLRTMLLDSIAVAGQAASNTRIENYLGPEREPRPCQRIGDEQCVARIRGRRGRRVRARCPKAAAVAR